MIETTIWMELTSEDLLEMYSRALVIERYSCRVIPMW
jgi:hypothetical protein